MRAPLHRYFEKSKCRMSRTIGTVEILPYTSLVTTGSERRKEALAAAVWRQLYGFFWMNREQHIAAVQELGLTPGHMKALFVLDLDEPRPMGALAEALAYNASTLTSLVDSP